MLTEAERAEMLSEVPVILARHNVQGPEFEALSVDLRAWLSACIIATGMYEYGRGQRSVLSPRI